MVSRDAQRSANGRIHKMQNTENAEDTESYAEQ